MALSTIQNRSLGYEIKSLVRIKFVPWLPEYQPSLATSVRRLKSKSQSGFSMICLAKCTASNFHRLKVWWIGRDVQIRTPLHHISCALSARYQLLAPHDTMWRWSEPYLSANVVTRETECSTNRTNLSPGTASGRSNRSPSHVLSWLWPSADPHPYHNI